MISIFLVGFADSCITGSGFGSWGSKSVWYLLIDGIPSGYDAATFRIFFSLVIWFFGFDIDVVWLIECLERQRER